MKNTQEQIQLLIVTGQMITHDECNIAGTIRIYSRDDAKGRSARRGKHTNFGYSGYYLASIFDGTKWRKLQFNALVPYDERSYEMASDKKIVEQYLADIISSWRGMPAQYDRDSRSFRIPIIEY